MQRRNFIQSAGISAAALTFAEKGMAFTPAEAHPVKRPICAFTKCLQFLSIEEAGEILARNGFDGADLAVRPGGQIEPSDVKTALPKAVKAYQKIGIQIPMIVTAISDPTDPETLAILQTAADCGIKYYRPGWFNYDLTKPIQQNLDGHKKTIEKLAALNEKLGIHGGYQNHSGTSVGAPVWDLYELMKEVDPRFMGVQYDIRHAVTEGGYSWILGLKRVEPWIRSICIKDFIWGKSADGKWQHQNVPLGEGIVNFDAFLKEYASLNVEAPISIHYEYDLGGAEVGKKVTSMPHDLIFQKMQKDLVWLRQALLKNNIGL